jgi:hypothetical protein
MTFLPLKNDVNVPAFRIRIRIRARLFLDLPDPLLRDTDPRIQIRILIRMVPKCHGSPTLLEKGGPQTGAQLPQIPFAGNFYDAGIFEQSPL